MLTTQQRQDILQNLGNDALHEILVGSPEIVTVVTENDAVVFWYRGLECEYYFDTSPPLLRIVESDKEVTSFDQLTQEISYELA